MEVGGQIMGGLADHWNDFNSYFQLKEPLQEAKVGTLNCYVEMRLKESWVKTGN